jgi:hypothetical protein
MLSTASPFTVVVNAFPNQASTHAVMITVINPCFDETDVKSGLLPVTDTVVFLP